MPFDDRSHARNLPRMLGGYLAMILATIGLFLLVRGYGEGLTAPAPLAAPAGAAVAVPAAGVAHPLVHLLIALAAVIVVGRLLAWLFAYLAQPPVIGEVLAGICLGPSLLGPHLRPRPASSCCPTSLAPSLAIIAQTRRDPLHVPGRPGAERRACCASKATPRVAISHASIVAPFSLGRAAGALALSAAVDQRRAVHSFALFMGVAMSITAFPVLARILTDRQLQQDRPGRHGPGLRRDRRRHRLVPAGAGRRRRAVAESAEALSVAVLTVAYIVVDVLRRPSAGGPLSGTPRRGTISTAGVAGDVLVGVLRLRRWRPRRSAFTRSSARSCSAR